jgi:hypothetical protein
MAMRANSCGGIAVSDLFSAYCELISSPAQLTRCQEATSVSELLCVIKHLWQQTALSDDQLIAELAQLNQQVISGDNIQLAGHWLPYRYHAKSRSIHWCLPAGHATEPFQDETISRYRQTVLVNQFITPKTALSSLDIQAQAVQSITPAGFIFHLSRCGSTLLSGCLSELETTSVFSESPVLTEILLDQTLNETGQQQYLQHLINLQASVFPARPNIVIKWNAWDIFRWKSIRAIYPQVPVIFLVRNPVEILASHQRSAGRHMSGDPSLADYHPVFAQWNDASNLLDKQLQVLDCLLSTMYSACSSQSTFLIDYQQLNVHTMVRVFDFLRIKWDQLVFLKIQERMQFHSKNPSQLFLPDTEKKQSLFTRQTQENIKAHLAVTYTRLLAIANNSRGIVINV